MIYPVRVSLVAAPLIVAMTMILIAIPGTQPTWLCVTLGGSLGALAHAIVFVSQP